MIRMRPLIPRWMPSSGPGDARAPDAGGLARHRLARAGWPPSAAARPGPPGSRPDGAAGRPSCRCRPHRRSGGPRPPLRWRPAHSPLRAAPARAQLPGRTQRDAGRRLNPSHASSGRTTRHDRHLQDTAIDTWRAAWGAPHERRSKARDTYTRCCVRRVPTLLSSVQSPRDLKALPAEQMQELAARDPGVPDRAGEPDRRTPRSQPRRGRADPGHPPGLRLAGRPDRLRHRAPELRAQDHHRPPGPVPEPAAARRPLRLSRARRSPSTTGSRTPTRRPPCPTRPGWPADCSSRVAPAPWSPSSATAPSPAAWPGRRSTTSPPTTTCRWSSWSTTTAAPTPRPSAAWPGTWPACGPTRGTSSCST